MFTKRSLTHESGQALIQVALAMVVLLAFVALAVDVGSDYAERRKMQNAADAGAMAGAMVLCRDQAAARTAALSMALANGAHLQAADITIDTVNKLVSVPVSTTAHSIFARILSSSFATNTVRAKATAKCGPVSTIGNGLFPVAVSNTNFITNTVYELQVQVASTFGWLSWNGDQSVGNLVQELTEANVGGALPHMVSVGDWVSATTGFNDSIAVRDAVNAFVGKTVIMPLFDVNSGTGSNSMYHIVGFAAFHIDSYQATGDNKYLRGTFINMAIPSTSTDGAACSICIVYGSRFTQ